MKKSILKSQRDVKNNEVRADDEEMKKKASRPLRRLSGI